MKIENLIKSIEAEPESLAEIQAVLKESLHRILATDPNDYRGINSTANTFSNVSLTKVNSLGKILPIVQKMEESENQLYYKIYNAFVGKVLQAFKYTIGQYNIQESLIARDFLVNLSKFVGNPSDVSDFETEPTGNNPNLLTSQVIEAEIVDE